MDELFAATPVGGSTWHNFFEKPTKMQFDHRVLAMLTYLATALLFASSRRAAVRMALPPAVLRATTAAFAMVNVQAALGISTLLYLVLPLRTKLAALCFSQLCFMLSRRYTDRMPLQERGDRRT